MQFLDQITELCGSFLEPGKNIDPVDVRIAPQRIPSEVEGCLLVVFPDGFTIDALAGHEESV